MEGRFHVSWHDGQARSIAKAAADDALKQAALKLREQAQRICPHEFGDLEGSATVEPLGGGRTGYRVAFGGPAAMYAIRQHEDTTLNHTNGRQAKYLETPFKAMAPRIPRLVELSVKAALRRGGG